MQQQTNYNHSYRPPQRRGFAARILPWLLIVLALVFVVLFGIRALRDSRVAQEIEPYEDVFADNIHVMPFSANARRVSAPGAWN